MAGCNIFSRKSHAGIPFGGEAPRKVSASRSGRASVSSAGRGRLSTSGMPADRQSHSRGASTGGGLRKGSAVLR
ncbi:unnamed protein product [Periconia digitata]|uniref:Uncharacterized protein n=1 Tax=Periconia digitata TaxID=1303443 RepID=A0A9W4UMH5_9PLEO|nr:unnamed protein product [Periconia digitata]